jgi:hypothetical protein
MRPLEPAAARLASRLGPGMCDHIGAKDTLRSLRPAGDDPGGWRVVLFPTQGGERSEAAVLGLRASGASALSPAALSPAALSCAALSPAAFSADRIEPAVFEPRVELPPALVERLSAGGPTGRGRPAGHG